MNPFGIPDIHYLRTAQGWLELDNLPVRKSEKRFERHELAAWKTAVREKGYAGSLSDWQCLLRRLGMYRGRYR